MSLIVELESVYNDRIQNKIQCLCKVIFKNATQIRTLDENSLTKQFKNDEFYEEDERSSFLSQTSQEIKYNLGSEIKSDDFLRIECFRIGRFHKK